MNVYFSESFTNDSQLENERQYAESIENFSEPHMEESLIQGGEFLDDAIRMTDQAFKRNKLTHKTSS